MKDKLFVENILQKGKEAKAKALREFSGISPEQFNCKPSTKSWSIAECFDHLFISDSLFFPQFREITEGNHIMTFWEKYSPLSSLLGNILKNQVQEEVKRKISAPKKLRPVTSDRILDLIDKYHKNFNIFLTYISSCKDLDIDKIIITSPAVGFVTYSLRDGLQFLIQHEHRHINQAIRVKENTEFPEK